MTGARWRGGVRTVRERMVVLLMAAALAGLSCGGGKAPGTSGSAASGGGETVAPRATETLAAPAWGQDTVRCDARVTAADGTTHALTLTLYPGGSATLRTAYAGGGEGLDLGWWSVRSDTLALQLATKDGRASGTTTTWKVEGTGLRPLVWNRGEWGAGGVPLRLREGAGRR